MSGRGGANGKRKANLLYSSRNHRGRKDDDASSSPMQPAQLTQPQEPRVHSTQQSIQPIQQPVQSIQQPEEEIHVSLGGGHSIPTPSIGHNISTPSRGHNISTPSSAGSCNSNKNTRGRYKCLKVDMKTKNGQIEAEIPDDILRAVGENARDIVNYCGWVVRTMAPLTVNNWKGVVDRVGEQMLKKVKDKFQVGDNLEYRLDTFALATMQRLYRCWRGRLHKIYKNFQTDEERLANQPEDVTMKDWKYLIDYFGREEFQGQLKELASQSTSEGSNPMIGDEMLLSVLGARSGYFRGKGCGKKAPSKKGRIQEDEINARISQAVKENTRFFEERIEQVKAEFNNKIESIIKSRLASILGALSQSNINNIPGGLNQVIRPDNNTCNPGVSFPSKKSSA